MIYITLKPWIKRYFQTVAHHLLNKSNNQILQKKKKKKDILTAEISECDVHL